MVHLLYVTKPTHYTLPEEKRREEKRDLFVIDFLRNHEVSYLDCGLNDHRVESELRTKTYSLLLAHLYPIHSTQDGKPSLDYQQALLRLTRLISSYAVPALVYTGAKIEHVSDERIAETGARGIIRKTHDFKRDARRIKKSIEDILSLPRKTRLIEKLRRLCSQ